MEDKARITAITDAAVNGDRRRIVGCAGAGKTRLLDLIAAQVDGPLVRWSPAIDRLPPEGPGLLLADDVHLADEGGLRSLLRWPGGVVAAHRPAERASERMLDVLDGAPTVLGPLDATALRRLLADMWSQSPDDAAVAQIAHATGAIPRLVLMVAGDSPDRPALGSAALHEAVRAERQRLDGAERNLLAAAAVLPGLDLSLLAAAADQQVNAAAISADRLRAHGLAVDGAAHLIPVVAAAVRSTVPATAIAAMIDRAATAAVDLGHDLPAVADHIAAASIVSPATVRCLLAAARDAVDSDPVRAQRWIDAAGSDAPSNDHAALRALAGFRRGDPRACIAAVDELVSTTGWRDSELQREAALAGAVTLARHSAWDRAAELARTVGARDDIAIGIEATAWFAAGNVAALRAVGGRRGDHGSGLVAATGHALAAGLAASVGPEPTSALPQLLDAARSYDLATHDVGLPLPPRVLAATVANQLWELDVAAQILTAASPADEASADIAALRAWIALRRGDWVGALGAAERLRAGQDPEPRTMLVVCAVEAGVARRRGDLATMDRCWREARSLLLRHSPDLLLAQPLTELLIVGARLNDRITIRTVLTGLHQLLDRAGHPALWTLPVLWDELHIAIATDELDAAGRAARAAITLAGETGRGAVVARAGMCWVSVLQGAVDATAVRVAAEALGAAGLGWEASRLAGAAALRMTDGAAMRDLLQYARDVTVERTPTLQAGTGPLSPRERDVATHLLAGLTYREIGGQLYIAPKTVEHHVARIRRKLGVSSRAELLVALRRHAAIV